MKHVLVVALLAIWCFPSACEAEKLDKIVVYGSQTCTYTGAFRGKLKQNGNQYVFKDIANGRSNAEMWNIVFSSSWYAGGSVSLPVVVVNGVAYERPEFNYVLNLINQGNGLIESCDVGLVSGQVYDSSGVGVLANIYLLNESDAGEFIHVCWTDSLGAYKCQGVSPGTYKVIVTWATNRQPFANIYGMSGNTFNVGAGESVTIENITVNGIDLEPALVLPTQARGELYWECADVLRKNYIFYLGFGTMNIFNISSNKLNVVQSGSGGYFNDIQYLPVSKLDRKSVV